MPPVNALAHLAARSHGVFSTAAALGAGLSHQQLRRLERDGLVTRLGRSLYRFAGAPLDWRARVYAATRLGGPLGMASHATAATLLGFDGFHEPAADATVEIVVPRSRRNADLSTLDPVTVHSSLRLEPADRSYVGVIPTTSPARTLAMLGCRLGPDRLEETWDDAERRRLAPRMPVTRRHRQIRARGRDGVGVLATVIERREAVGSTPWNAFERRFLRQVIAAHGLPAPICQMKVELPEGRVVWVDFGFPAARFGVEIHGHGSHATRAERARDASRHNAVLLAQIDLAYFTWEQVTRTPGTVAQELRNHLRRRGLAA